MGGLFLDGLSEVVSERGDSCGCRSYVFAWDILAVANYRLRCARMLLLRKGQQTWGALWLLLISEVRLPPPRPYRET
jgi:hypothetical protein